MSSNEIGGARPKTRATPQYSRRNISEDSDSENDTGSTHVRSRQSAVVQSENDRNSSTSCDCSTYICGRIKLCVYMTDITKATTDAVVSSENGNLKSKAPLATLIWNAAGLQYQENLERLRRDNAKSRYGTALVAKSEGHSSWKFVVLAVIPRWCEEKIDLCKRNFYRAFTNIFDVADENGAETISLPVLGTGNRNAPAGEVMEIFCKALKDFAGRARCLTEVHLVSLDPTLKVFAVECCDRALSDVTNCGYLISRMSLTDRRPAPQSIVTHPALPTSEPTRRGADDSSDTCSICLEVVKTYLRQELSCKHAFCVGCIRKWLNNCRSCPVCRNTSV